MMRGNSTLAMEEGDVGGGLCFVGSFLTASVFHFQAIRTTLANLWHPLG